MPSSPSTELHTWLLLLAYQGDHYAGWQIQPHCKTIEAELERAVEKISGTPTKVHGAGRTDSGVHALNQTAHFQTYSPLEAERWQAALNGVLPGDIVVKAIRRMPPDFHARHSSVGKRYAYRVYNRTYQSPFARNRCWWVRRPLDWEAIESAIPFLLGEHDFTSFRSTQCSSPSPFKTLHAINIQKSQREDHTHQIEVYGNSFLQHMVRILVGTLVDVGRGRLRPEQLAKILEARDRSRAGQTAPAHGLYVKEVVYPEGMVVWKAEEWCK